MKLKKFLALTVAVVMTMSMAVGCGSDDSNENGGSNDAENKTTEFDASYEISVVSREEGSGTRGAFIELFGIEQKDANGEKVDYTTTEADFTNSTSVMLSTVAGDEYAIGYVSLGSLNDTVKALKVDGVEATEANIKAGTYKAARPFNIATKEDMDNEAAKDFINYILSADGQAIVAENGYIALDAESTFESTGAEGKVVVGGSSSVSPVMEKLIESYKEVNPNAEIELQTTDSTTGMTSAIDGSYDIGMASRELKEEEIAGGLVGQVIATDGIAVIVNLNNPTEDMTVDQVNTIYVGEAYTWDEVVE